MSWTVYILKSVSGEKHYVGCTNDVARRLTEHNAGYNRATRWHRPWHVVYSEIFTSEVEAYAREKQIKSYKGGNAFKKLIE